MLGLGHVGALVGAGLAAAGARLTVTDVDPSRRALAERWGASWAEPGEAFAAEVDMVVPCAVGGILNPHSVSALRCRAVVGAANNQLDADPTAALLLEHGVCWAPDTVVSAGGIVSAVAREIEHVPAAEADHRVGAIGRRLGEILAGAADQGITPLAEARRRTRELLAAG